MHSIYTGKPRRTVCDEDCGKEDAREKQEKERKTTRNKTPHWGKRKVCVRFAQAAKLCYMSIANKYTTQTRTRTQLNGWCMCSFVGFMYKFLVVRKVSSDASGNNDDAEDDNDDRTHATKLLKFVDDEKYWILSKWRGTSRKKPFHLLMIKSH